MEKNENTGNAYVLCNFNNLSITICDYKGKIMTKVSAASLGFSNSKVHKIFVAKQVANKAGKYAIKKGIKKLKVYVNGYGFKREELLNELSNVGLEILFICDRTPIPHNGARRPARRK